MGHRRKTDKETSSLFDRNFSYSIELEIFESGGCRMHKVGDKLKYPQDMGIMCPFLLDSANSIIIALLAGGTFPWKYEDTPYEKEIDPEGITTEFVRCPDPTSAGVVLKIIRKKNK
jgi:uncharacterized repeat protein (TIGR04076 family)